MTTYSKGDHDYFLRVLDTELKYIRELLARKNKDYGNAALNPTPTFTTTSVQQRLYCRLDEKLSRIRQMTVTGKPLSADDLRDTIGCIILLLMEGEE